MAFYNIFQFLNENLFRTDESKRQISWKKLGFVDSGFVKTWTRCRNVENETIWISSRFSQMKEKLLKIAENSQTCLGFRLEQLFLRLWKQKGFIVKPKTIPWLSQFATGMWSLMNIVYDLVNDTTRVGKNLYFVSKIVLAIEKNFRNSRLKGENLQNIWNH